MFRVGIAYAVVSWVLLQLADLVLDNINAPDWVMQAFMLALAIGFPVVLIIAWAFELTPDGIKRDKDVDREQSITHQTASRLNTTIIAFLAIAVVVLLVDRFIPSDESGNTVVSAEQVSDVTAESNSVRDDSAPPVIREKSIAVLPLANRSANPEDAFFAEGLHDEILTQLSRVSALRVISRTSVLGYADTTKRMTEIGQELGVAALVEGGVQRAGDRVRINVQLIDTATDEHLWAEVYDRDLTTDNLFEIQSDITQSIARELQAVLTGDEEKGLAEKPTQSIEAYAYYLRGRAESAQYGRDPWQIEKTIAYYQSALDLDPEFSEAWAALSTDYSELYWSGDRLDEPVDALRALRKAQALAPDSADTFNAQGYLYYWGYLDYENAIEAFEKALRHEPGKLSSLRGLAFVNRRFGNRAQTIENFQRVLEIDPLNSVIPADLGYALLRFGEFNRAADLLRHAYLLDPENRWSAFVRAFHDQMIGDLDTALRLLGPMIDENSASFLTVQMITIALAKDDFEAAEQFAGYLDASNFQGISGSPGIMAHVLLVLGKQTEYDTMVSLYERNLETISAEYPDNPNTIRMEVTVAGLQKDPKALETALQRYATLLPPDAMRLIEDRSVINALAMVGEPDAVVALMQEIVGSYGPWEMYYMAQSPLFDDMRGNPQFDALIQQYDAWKAETVPLLQ